MRAIDADALINLMPAPIHTSPDGQDLVLMSDVMEAIKRAATIESERTSVSEWQKDFRDYVGMLNIPRDDYNGIMEYINEVPSAQSDSCNGCKWEDALGYGECHHCKRRYDDMYEVKAIDFVK